MSAQHRHAPVPPVDATLRLIVVIYRVFAFVWMSALCASTLITDDGASDTIVVIAWAVAALFTLLLPVLGRDRTLVVSGGYLMVEGAAAIWIGLASGFAESAHLIHGGYLVSWLILLVYGRPSAWVAFLGISLMSATQVAVPFLSDARTLEITEVIGGTALFAIATLIPGWGMEALRRSEIRRTDAEAALEEERLRRQRSDDRADIAAHLHDSVLQTLALIQQRDDGEMSRLARRQELALRRFIDRISSPYEESCRAALREVVADVEDLHGIRVEVVITGDRGLDEPGRAAIAATQEALANAARHSGSDKISLYAECGDESLAVFVRDRGVGFEHDGVAPDRRGISESIVARMARHGGDAKIHSIPGEGTEVEITVGARR
jgi:signal transduction histidine kinase